MYAAHRSRAETTYFSVSETATSTARHGGISAARRSGDTASQEELARKADLLRAHAKAVREHVKVLGDKAYWNAFSDAPDFVIAFIPNESLLQAALETDPTLMDDAFAREHVHGG